MNHQGAGSNSRTLLRRLIPRGAVLLAAFAMFIAGLAFTAPPASALETLGNGVRTDGSRYWCDGKLAEPATEQWVFGTTGDDVILVMGDTVEGVNAFSGDDSICSLTLGVLIIAGHGDDTVYTADIPDGWGQEFMPINVTHGGPGNDVIRGGTGFDNMDGAWGDDLLDGGDGYDFLWGGSGNDLFKGGANGDEQMDGTAEAGDLCVDINFHVNSQIDVQSGCERYGESDPFALQSMPLFPEPVDGCPAGGIREVTLPDGTILEMGSGCSGFAHFR